jgi:ketosteroid isomerase-like protein
MVTLSQAFIHKSAALAVSCLTLGGCATPTPASQMPHDAAVQAVTTTEQQFADTMARRDFAAFLSFVADDAVFLNGGKPLAGKQAIGDRWRAFFDAPAAPFSWKPELVVVLASGALATSTGPVSNPSGQVFSRFHSTWRLEGDGRWRIVFDNGYPVCRCENK